jgi:hypothetical protein
MRVIAFRIFETVMNPVEASFSIEDDTIGIIVFLFMDIVAFWENAFFLDDEILIKVIRVIKQISKPAASPGHRG